MSRWCDLHLAEKGAEHVCSFGKFGEARGGLVKAGLDHRADDRLLACEIVVEMTGTNLGLRADARDARALQSVAHETALCGAQNLPSLFLVPDRVELAHNCPHFN